MLNRFKETEDRILLLFSKIQKPALNKFMVFLSVIGNGGTIWLLISVPMLLNRASRVRGIKLIISLVFAGFCGEIIIKRLVCRVRPSEDLEPEELLIKHPKTYSFPSGHTASSVAAAFTISFGFPFLALPAFFLAFLIAFSRLYLQVHYPSDILAGTALGVICSLLVNTFCII
ncbi:MAG: phosphatase PAP2 family protein [Clostridia bacterium]|nr:phosphatase PAP2 family protein [Clostridia bacterium]